MRQATLVTAYGPKPAHLSALLLECQRMLTEALGDSFQPYELSQIHATIIGLEHLLESPNCNLNLWRFRSRLGHMDLPGFVASVLTHPCFPMSVQFGGFADRDYPFTSRGQRPFDRSFSIQGTKAVLIGWPVRGKPAVSATRQSQYSAAQESRLYPTSLDDVRRFALNFNILHEYHSDITDTDNDCYLRLGLCNGTSDLEAGQIVQAKIRRYLGQTDPVFVEISKADLNIVSYTDGSLPCGSTRSWPIVDKASTSDLTGRLYRD